MFDTSQGNFRRTHRGIFYGLSVTLAGVVLLVCSFSLGQIVVLLDRQVSASADTSFIKGEFVISAIEEEGREGTMAQKIAEALPDVKIEQIAQDMGADGNKTIYHIVKKEGSPISDKEVLVKIEALPADKTGQIASAERNGRLRIALEPNDTYWTNNSLWGLKKIAMQQAWDLTTGSSDVVVADIDTGVNYNHADLAANMWKNPGEIPGNGIDDDGNGYVDDVYGIDSFNNDSDPMDDGGHGTHTAGTVGAVGNNGVGVVGVNWTAKIMALKFLGAGGWGTDAGAIAGFNYVVAMKNRGVNVRVTNNSWGTPRDPRYPFSQALKDAIDAAGNAGIINIFAAGNNGTDNDVKPFDPASFATNAVGSTTPPSTSIMAVAASNLNDDHPLWSNYGGASVHLAAPGDKIWSTYLNTYSETWGTSMATPHVAGTAALLLAKKPDLTVAQLKSLILDNVDQLNQWKNKVITGGRLNAFKALQAVNNIAPPPQKANLKVSSFAVSPILSQPSDPLAATAIVQNSGSADAGAFVVDFYQNRNAAPPATQGDQRVTVDSLAAGATKTLTFSFNSPNQVNDFKAWAQVDTTGLIDESDETDNVASFNYQTSRPDLSVTSLTITPNPSTAGAELTVSATVKNIGGYGAPAFTAGFFKDRANAPGASDTGDKTWPVAGLAAGAQTTLEHKFTPAGDGSYKGWAFVDSGDKVVELLENNNASSGISYTVKKQADLIIESFSLSPADLALGGTTTAAIKVKNQGDMDTGAFKVDFYKNSAAAPANTLAGDKTWDVASLAAGASATLTFDFAPSPVGGYKGWAQVDRANQIAEADETNNTAGPAAYSVKAPDLLVESLTVAPASSSLGTKLTAAVVAKNNGNLAVGAFDLDFYQNLTNAPDANTQSTQRWNIPSLAAGASVTKTFDFTPAAKGGFKAYAQVDTTGKVAESNEANNIAGPLDYTVKQADLIVESFSLSPADLALGGTTTAAIKVKNQGDMDTGAFKVDFYKNSAAAPANTLAGDKTWDVASLAAGASATLTFDFAPSPVGDYKGWAQVDRANQIAEADETNNTAGPAAYSVKAPDLLVESLTVAPTTSNLTAKLTASATVKNGGNSPASAFKVSFFDDRANAPSPGDAGATKTWDVALLAVGATTTLTFDYTPAKEGGYKAWGVIDSGTVVAESNEANNIVGPISYSVILPNLKVKTLTAAPAKTQLGAEVSLEAVVENTAAVASPSFEIGFYQNLSSPPTAATPIDGKAIVGSIEPGKTATEVFKFKPGQKGVFTGYVLVDPAGQLAENAENDNLAKVNYEVVAQPDLAITAFDLSPTSVSLGETVTATFTVKNQGTVAAGAFEIDIYENLASAPAANKAGDKTLTVASLAVGATATQTHSFALESVGKNKSWAVVDRQNKVDETNEINNLSGPVEYTVAAPDLTAELTIDPPDTEPGVERTAKIKAKNIGGKAAGETKLALYLDRSSAPKVGEAGDYNLAVASLATDAEITLEQKFTTDKLGSYKAWARVDFENTFKEPNETNNLAGPVEYRTTQTDLVIRSFTVTPSSSTVGDTLTARLTIANEGDRDSLTSTLDLYKHAEKEPANQAGDVTLILEVVPAGKTVNQTIEFSQLKEGDYQAWVRLDRDNKVNERHKNNNLNGPHQYKVKASKKPTPTPTPTPITPPTSAQPTPETKPQPPKQSPTNPPAVPTPEPRQDEAQPPAKPIPPPAPVNLTVRAVSLARVELSWEAPPGIGQARYVILRNGREIGQTNETQFSDNTTSGPHSYVVKTVDASGNQSESANPTSSVEIPESLTSDITGLATTRSNATITLNTNLPTKATIEWGTSVRTRIIRDISYVPVINRKTRQVIRYRRVIKYRKETYLVVAGRVSDDEFNHDHSLTIEKLRRSRKYYFQTVATTEDDDQLTSPIQNFRTARR